MNIAELFVKIGLNGDNAVVKGLKSVSSAFDYATSASLKTKISMLAVFYGLERFTNFGAKLGASFYRFREGFGLPIDELQKWQYGLSQVGVSTSEVQSTLENLQKKMAETEILGEAPRVFSILGIDPRGKDPFQVLKEIQSQIKKLDPKLGLEFTKDIFSPEFFIGIRAMKDIEKIKPPSMLTNRDIDNLQKINARWQTLMNSLEVRAAKFLAKHGGDWIAIINKISNLIFTILPYVEKVLDKIITGYELLAKTIKNPLSFLGEKNEATGVDTTPMGVLKTMFNDLNNMFMPKNYESEKYIQEAMQKRLEVKTAQNYVTREAQAQNNSKIENNYFGGIKIIDPSSGEFIKQIKKAASSQVGFSQKDGN